MDIKQLIQYACDNTFDHLHKELPDRGVEWVRINSTLVLYPNAIDILQEKWLQVKWENITNESGVKYDKPKVANLYIDPEINVSNLVEMLQAYNTQLIERKNIMNVHMLSDIHSITPAAIGLDQDDEPAIKPGDVVRLKSGSPKLTVGSISDDIAEISYFDEYKLHQFSIPIATLKLDE